MKNKESNKIREIIAEHGEKFDGYDLCVHGVRKEICVLCEICEDKKRKEAKMTYRKDESKEYTIKWLEAKLVDLRREVRTIENAIDYLKDDTESKESK